MSTRAALRFIRYYICGDFKKAKKKKSDEREQLDSNEKCSFPLSNYADEHVENFIKLLDANVRSQVEYSDFKGLEEELARVRYNEIPFSLVSISNKIKMNYGDVTKDSSQSDYAALPSYVLLGAAVKEMDDLKLEQVDEDKIVLWRDAINSALNVQFKVDFFKEHLKRIARAYFGLKANDGKRKEKLRNIDVKVIKTEDDKELNSDDKEEEQTSKVRLLCLREAEYFQGKRLTTGLLR
ncbi:hypothetical protein COLO4_17130 [Corchorus olitorius]|uniref:Uncharacterized protein n=1 Tax=Corchorus olitorius TaxID=93759 RepID=A0A1R3JE38_9ROSI|nr:hypothetical protein COLO4_17130 [Corchorus olitorius]